MYTCLDGYISVTGIIFLLYLVRTIIEGLESPSRLIDTLLMFIVVFDVMFYHGGNGRERETSTFSTR